MGHFKYALEKIRTRNNNDIFTARPHTRGIYNDKSSVLSKKCVCTFIFSHQLSWFFTLNCFHPQKKQSHVVYHNCLLIFLECTQYLSTRAVWNNYEERGSIVSSNCEVFIFAVGKNRVFFFLLLENKFLNTINFFIVVDISCCSAGSQHIGEGNIL